MPRCVLLRHTLPGDTWHYDWMLQPPGSASGTPLVTLRVRSRIDTDPAPAPAEPIHDHRAVYLDYEGPVSGDRGRVERVASGACLALTREPFAATCDWGQGPVGYRLVGEAIVRAD